MISNIPSHEAPWGLFSWKYLGKYRILRYNRVMLLNAIKEGDHGVEI